MFDSNDLFRVNPDKEGPDTEGIHIAILDSILCFFENAVGPNFREDDYRFQIEQCDDHLEIKVSAPGDKEHRIARLFEKFVTEAPLKKSAGINRKKPLCALSYESASRNHPDKQSWLTLTLRFNNKTIEEKYFREHLEEDLQEDLARRVATENMDDLIDYFETFLRELNRRPPVDNNPKYSRLYLNIESLLNIYEETLTQQGKLRDLNDELKCLISMRQLQWISLPYAIYSR